MCCDSRPPISATKIVFYYKYDKKMILKYIPGLVIFWIDFSSCPPSIMPFEFDGCATLAIAAWNSSDWGVVLELTVWLSCEISFCTVMELLVRNFPGSTVLFSNVLFSDGGTKLKPILFVLCISCEIFSILETILLFNGRIFSHFTLVVNDDVRFLLLYSK